MEKFDDIVVLNPLEAVVVRYKGKDVTVFNSEDFGFKMETSWYDKDGLKFLEDGSLPFGSMWTTPKYNIKDGQRVLFAAKNIDETFRYKGIILHAAPKKIRKEVFLDTQKYMKDYKKNTQFDLLSLIEK